MKEEKEERGKRMIKLHRKRKKRSKGRESEEKGTVARDIRGLNRRDDATVGGEVVRRGHRLIQLLQIFDNLLILLYRLQELKGKKD